MQRWDQVEQRTSQQTMTRMEQKAVGGLRSMKSGVGSQSVPWYGSPVPKTTGAGHSILRGHDSKQSLCNKITRKHTEK